MTGTAGALSVRLCAWNSAPVPDVSFTGLFVVVATAFVAPFLLGLFPGLRIPGVVLEIVLGIVLGPSGLGWVEVDLPIQVLSLVGLAFLLLLAGLEVDIGGLRGQRLRLPAIGLALSVGLAAIVAGGLGLLGVVQSPVLIGVILITSALGLVVAVLKDAGIAETEAGQLIIAAATLGDVSAVILLSLLFSQTEGGPGATLLLLIALVLLGAAVLVTAGRLGRLQRVAGEFMRLADTTAQLRVRAAVVLLIGFVALASSFGIETILGAFMAGLLLGRLDPAGRHPAFRAKLDGLGYGFLIPIFFITSGLQFDLRALLADGSALVLVPVFLLALLVVRGVPALLYRGVLSGREIAGAALLQATTLPFVVAATMLGRELDLLTDAVAAALVAAGLLSVLVFPLVSLTLLRSARPSPDRKEPR